MNEADSEADNNEDELVDQIASRAYLFGMNHGRTVCIQMALSIILIWSSGPTSAVAYCCLELLASTGFISPFRAFELVKIGVSLPLVFVEIRLKIDQRVDSLQACCQSVD